MADDSTQQTLDEINRKIDGLRVVRLETSGTPILILHLEDHAEQPVTLTLEATAQVTFGAGGQTKSVSPGMSLNVQPWP